MKFKNFFKNIKINKGLYLINVDKYLDKTKEELWDPKIKNKFLIWVLFLIFSMIVILGINIAVTIGVSLNVKSEDPYATYKIIVNILKCALSVSIIATLIYSLDKCIKNKSFKFISLISTFFIFIMSIFSLFDIISYILSVIPNTNIIIDLNSWFNILMFLLTFIYPIIWFFISRNVSLIRNIFIRAETKEFLMKQTNNEANPFAPNSFNGETAQHNQSNSNELYNNKYNDKFYSRLKKLSREQIEQISKSLAISGYETMSNEELINIIYDIRSVQDVNSNDIEVEINSNKKEEKEN